MPECSSKKVNNIFLIGAGFTKAVSPEKAPLNADLLQSVIDHNLKTLLKKYKIRYRTDDIEILLTYMDLETVELESERLKQDRKAINKDIADYFQQFRFGRHENNLKSTAWLKQIAREVFTEYDAIITTNYDCLLEGVLDYYEIWCPSTGYRGVEVDVPGTSLQNLQNPKNILIYKIHGSENFHTCDINDVNIDPNHIGLVVNQEIYPKSGAGCNLGVVSGWPYIIAPSFIKTFYPQIERMMIGALYAAKKAKNLVIVGCGLRPEDSYLRLLIAGFLSGGPDKVIIVVDPKAETLRDRITDYWREAKVQPVAKRIEEGIDELLGLIKCKGRG